MYPTPSTSIAETTMKIHLETEHLILRYFQDTDEEHLFTLDSDPDVMRFFPDDQVDRQEIHEYLQTMLALYQKYENLGFWAVHEKQSNGFIGWFLFRPWREAPYYRPDIADPDDVELGYRFHKSAWGKGYATEGSRSLIHQGFYHQSINNIFAGAVPENKASIRVLQKVGLKYQIKFFDETLKSDLLIYQLKRLDYNPMLSL